MSDQIDAKEWYNKFAAKQVKTGLNLRHYTIINNCVANGLNSKSSVLEIGCGVGTLTTLLCTLLKEGSIVSTDISDESVRIAQQNTAHANDIKFYVHNMQGFDIGRKFDFIILPDVMEHIPIEQHLGLFHSIVRHMSDHSIVLINSPHPKALDYIRAHHPEKLQVIDQSLNAGVLVNTAQEAGLSLISYQSYSLYIEETDYTFISLRKDLPLDYTPISNTTIRLKKLKRRLKLTFG